MAKGCSCSSSFCCKLWGFAIFLIIIIGIIVFVLWLLIHPNPLKSHAEVAQLKRFNLTNNTLSYDLVVQLSIRNPGHRVRIQYDRLDATASYDGQRIGHDDHIPDFHQGSKSTVFVNATFAGQKVVTDRNVPFASKFHREMREGFFYVGVKLSMRVRFKVWSVKTNRYRPKIRCTLRLPVPASAPAVSSDGFTRTKCDVDF